MSWQKLLNCGIDMKNMTDHAKKCILFKDSDHMKLFLHSGLAAFKSLQIHHPTGPDEKFPYPGRFSFGRHTR